MPIVQIASRLAGFGLASIATAASTVPGSLVGLLRAIERRLEHLIDVPASLASVAAELRRISVAIESVPELRDDMSALPQTVEQLEARMAELLTAIAQLMGVVEELAAATHPLHSVTDRIEQLERSTAKRPRRWLRGGQDAAATS
jgi:DNA repair ATPase RecN